MTAAEVLVLWAWAMGALIFGWGAGSLVGYWHEFGWPWTGMIRRQAARRRHKEAEVVFARWIERHEEELHDLSNNIMSVALFGMTSEEVKEMFATLGRELRSRA